MKKEAIIVVTITLLICFVNAAHLATTTDGGSSFEVGAGYNYKYKINITNTALNPNITEVNITIPSILKFNSGTHGTNAFFQNFVNTSNTLSWNNFVGYLINAGEQNYFEFVANATKTGSYSITITTLDSSGAYSSTLSLEVSTTCHPDWDCTSWSSCINSLQTRTCTDLNSCGNESGKPDEEQSCSSTSTTTCIQNWSCTSWSDCVGGTQIRKCNDLNFCGNLSGKPDEEQSCQSQTICTPLWTCTDWQPEKCKKEEVQTRTCTDSNYCGANQDKPTESRTCKANSRLFFIIIVTIIITVLIFVGITLMLVLKKQREELENKQINPSKLNPHKIH